MTTKPRMFQKLAITKELGHVAHDENLFVREIMQTGFDTFEATFVVDGKHPYLYENPEIANHVSGTTFFEVSRQLMKATGHLYYDVPENSRFLLKSLEIEFERWGKIGAPVQAVIEVISPGRSGNASGAYAFRLSFYQDGWLLGDVNVKASAMPAQVEERMMSRQYRQIHMPMAAE